VILKDLPLDDPKQRCPDISLAKEILNWQPKIPIELGLQKTAAYFKGILEK
jgi:nucleoside-diphosphate-sugar epimerase